MINVIMTWLIHRASKRKLAGLLAQNHNGGSNAEQEHEHVPRVGPVVAFAFPTRTMTAKTWRPTAERRRLIFADHGSPSTTIHTVSQVEKAIAPFA